MNKEIKNNLEYIMESMDELRQAFADFTLRESKEPKDPPILFQDYCKECNKETIHKSEIESNQVGWFSCSSVETAPIPLALKTCLSCGIRIHEDT